MEKSIIRLRQIMTEHYSLDELRSLCFSMGVDYEELGEGGKTVKIQSLILYLGHQHRLEELLQNIQGDRPHLIEVSEMYADPEMIESLYESLPAIEKSKKPRIKEENILINRVYSFWIEGVLNQSTRNIALIDLAKETQAEAVTHAWEQVLEMPDQERQTLLPDKKISNLFEDADRLLLILGDAGSGKTITLLQLANDLISQAKKDSTQPVPVIFNLSTWENDNQTISEWLVAELAEKYQIPKRFGVDWLNNTRILPMLDGFDEVKKDSQADCVEAINHYIEEYGFSGVTVCSRTNEYMGLPNRLKLNMAVRLLPLTLEQVYDYLESADADLKELRASLDNDTALQKLALSPLTLGIMSLAYQDLPIDAIGEPKNESIELRRKHLFQTYIQRMFRRKGNRSKPFDDSQVISWLSWLANQMNQYNRSIFLVEQLQPEWLSTGKSQWVYFLVTRLTVGLIVGLLVGLIIGIFPGVACGIIGGIWVGAIDGFWNMRANQKLKYQPPRNVEVVADLLFVGLSTWLIIMLAGAILVNLFWGFVFGTVFGAVFGITFGLRKNRNPKNDVQTVEALSWSWLRAAKYGILGFVAGIFIGFLAELIFRSIFWSSIESPLVAWLGTPFIFSAVGGISGFIFGGLHSNILAMKTIPNQGIKLSIRNSLLAGSIAGLILMILVMLFGDLAGWLVDILSGGLVNGLRGGVIGGLIAGLSGGGLVAMWYGGMDIIQHYALRILLVFQGHTPRDYPSFLDYDTELIFLQRVGGGYSFIHRLLLEHFASIEIPQKSPVKEI